ncbi:LysR substrate-binding domain-containing protein, partial [Priestia megaterium]|uniref:LysR substrate-binding domain-containing protein n=1 Tax=Priestia megaterium TaxID=1404 RepID=UPI00211D6777
ALYAGALQDQLSRFRDRYPGVDLQVSEWPMGVLPELLQQGRVDVVFCRPPMDVPDSFGEHTLVEDQFCVALPETHPLAQARSQV